MRVFLSYSTKDKELAGQIKSALEDYGLIVFLAHEDIEPSAEWIDTIIAELEATDVFIPILTKDFKESDWTSQEIGIAVANDKLVIPLKMTIDPYGFISPFQALKIDIDEIAVTCRRLINVIAKKPVFGDLLRDSLITRFGNSWSFEDAADATDILLSFEEGYTLQQITNIIRHAITNSQINDSFKARRRLGYFVERHRGALPPNLVKAFYEAIRE